MARTAVIAIGGNALILEGQRGTIAEQFENARDDGPPHRGAGRGRLAGRADPRQRAAGRVHPAALGAGRPTTRRSRASHWTWPWRTRMGGVGYIIANSLVNELGTVGPRRSRRLRADPDGGRSRATRPSSDPTKPIGPAYSAAEAERLQAREGWSWSRTRAGLPAGRGLAQTAADRGGWRDPRARRSGYVVIACGGGGIPVVETGRASTGASRRSSIRTSPPRCWRPRSASRPSSSRPVSRRWRFGIGGRTSAILDRMTPVRGQRLPGGRGVSRGQHGPEDPGGHRPHRRRWKGGRHHVARRTWRRRWPVAPAPASRGRRTGSARS